MVFGPEDLYAKVTGQLEVRPKNYDPLRAEYAGGAGVKIITHTAILSCYNQTWANIREIRDTSTGGPLGRRLAWDYLDKVNDAAFIDHVKVTRVEWIHKDGEPYDTRQIEGDFVRDALNQEPRTESLARRVIDEMAQMILGRRKKAKLVDVKSSVDIYTDDGWIHAKATGVLSNGQWRNFDIKRPLDDEDVQALNLVKVWKGTDSEGNDRWNRLRKFEIELNHKHRQTILDLRDKVMKKAWAWVHDKEAGLEYGKLKKPEVIKLGYEVYPLVHSFRYVRFAKGSRKGMDSVLALAQSAAPGESVLKVEGADHSHTGFHYVYYLLLSPEERAEFDNRRRRVERERVGGMLGR